MFSDFPFKMYRLFDVMILFVDKGFLITVNGKLYTGHKYSDGPDTIGQIGGLKIICYGDTDIRSVRHLPGLLANDSVGGYTYINYNKYF